MGPFCLERRIGMVTNYIAWPGAAFRAFLPAWLRAIESRIDHVKTTIQDSHLPWILSEQLVANDRQKHCLRIRDHSPTPARIRFLTAAHRLPNLTWHLKVMFFKLGISSCRVPCAASVVAFGGLLSLKLREVYPIRRSPAFAKTWRYLESSCLVQHRIVVAAPIESVLRGHYLTAQFSPMLWRSAGIDRWWAGGSFKKLPRNIGRRHIGRLLWRREDIQ